MPLNVCDQCQEPLIEIDRYDERLIGCVACNRWGWPDDKNLIMELPEEDIAALRKRVTPSRSPHEGRAVRSPTPGTPWQISELCVTLRSRIARCLRVLIRFGAGGEWSYGIAVGLAGWPKTWLDRLLLWQRAYETRIFDAHRDVIGRGPTPEASQKAAERKWDTKLPVEEK